MVIGVTQAARLDLDQHLALTGTCDLDLIDLEGAVLRNADGGS
jgi:hypothetical protein